MVSLTMPSGATKKMASVGDDVVKPLTVELIPGGPSTVTVTSEAPLPEGAVAAALDEAGDYQLAGQ